MKKERWLPALGLVAIVGFHIIVNLDVLGRSGDPFVYDAAECYTLSTRYHRFGKLDDFRPPLKAVATHVTFSIFGISKSAACFTNIPFLILLLYAVYSIGRHIASRETGLLAAFLVSLFPQVFGHTRSHLTEIPMISFLCLSLWFLLKSDGMTKSGWVLGAGIAAGLGWLTKMTFPLYLVGPAAFIFGHALLRAGSSRRLMCARAAMGVMAFALVSLPWYTSRGIPAARIYVGRGHYSFEQEGVSFFSFEHFLWYPKMLLEGQLYWPLALAFAASVAIALWTALRRRIATAGNRGENARKVVSPGRDQGRFSPGLFIAVWVFSTYLLLLPFAMRNPRYSMPALPAVGLMIALGLERLRSGAARKVATVCVLVVGILQCLTVTYWPGASALFPILENVDRDTPGLSMECFQQWFGTPSPRKRDWKGEDIMHLVINGRDMSREVRLLFSQVRPFVYGDILNRIAGEDVPIEILASHDTLMFLQGDELATSEELDSLISKADFVVLVEEPRGLEPLESEALLRRLLLRKMELFERVACYDIPDGSSVLVYRRAR